MSIFFNASAPDPVCARLPSDVYRKRGAMTQTEQVRQMTAEISRLRPPRIAELGDETPPARDGVGEWTRADHRPVAQLRAGTLDRPRLQASVRARYRRCY